MILELGTLIILMITSVIMDLKTHTIKNVIPIVGIIIGILLKIYCFDFQSLSGALLVSIIYFFTLFFIPRILNIHEFMGAADIKLYITIAFLMGWRFSVYVFIYSIFIGCVGLITLNLKRIKEIYINLSLLILGNKDLKETTIKNIDSSKPNTFCIYIFISIIVAYIQLFIINNDWLLKNFIK